MAEFNVTRYIQEVVDIMDVTADPCLIDARKAEAIDTLSRVNALHVSDWLNKTPAELEDAPSIIGSTDCDIFSSF